MTALRYTPGSASVAVADAGAVVVGVGAPPALIAAVWRHLRGGGGIVGIIDVLAAGGPLSALPDFAIVVAEGDGWRVAVRGALSITRADGVAIDTGTGAPWIERGIPGDAALTVTADADFDAGTALPLVDGVARACAVVVSRSLAAPDPSTVTARPASAPVEPVQPHTIAEVHDAASAPPVDATPVVEAESATADVEAEEPGSADVEAAEPAHAAPPVEPVQPRTVAEVHDEVPGITDSIPEHLRPVRASTPPAAPPVPPLPPVPAAASISPVAASSAPPVAASPAPPVAASPVRPAAASPEPPVAASPVSPASPPVPAPPESTAAPASAVAPASADDDLDETLLRGASAPELADDVEATLIRDGGTADAAPVGDHDGETISLEEARRLRAAGQLPPAPATVPPVPASPPPAPPAGRAVLSTGQTVVLDRILVVGRRPRSTRAGGTVPHLVAVDSPHQDISRTHLEVRPEGDTLLATDLNTTNGTTLRRPGAEPVRLHPGEPTVVVTGDVLDLGEGITVTVEAPA